MPYRISNATGNWSDSTNWYTASNNPVFANGNTNAPTGRYTRTFTAPSTTNKCVGVVLVTGVRTDLGNVTISLQENSTTVLTQTFLAGDNFPAMPGTYFFRFTTPYQYTTTTTDAYRFYVVGSQSTHWTNADTNTTMGFIAVDDRTGPIASNDFVYILADVPGSAKTITYDQNNSSVGCQYFVIGYNATLEFSRSMTTRLIVGNATTTVLGEINTGGALTLGTAANPIPAQYTATLELDGSSTAHNNYLYVYNNALGYGRIETCGTASYNAGAQTVAGYATGKYSTTIPLATSAGQTSFVLSEDIGLQPGGGDLIAFAEKRTTGATGNLSQHQSATTTSYDPATKTMTINTGLTNARAANCRICTLSRNVTIKAVNTLRRAIIIPNAVYVTAQPSTPSRFAHTAFENMQWVGGVSFGGIFSNMTGIEIIGCSNYIRNSTATSNGFQALVWTRAVNNCTYLTGFYQLQNFWTTSNTMSPPLFYGNYNIGGIYQTFANSTIENCYANSADTFLRTSNQVTVLNSQAEHVRWVTYSAGYEIEFRNLTVTYCSHLSDSGVDVRFRNCTFDSLSAVIYNGTQQTIISDCVSTGTAMASTTPIWTFPYPAYITYNNQPSNRSVFAQNWTITGYSFPSTAVYFRSCVLGRYTAATAPDAVFPLPSNASNVGRVFNIEPGIKVLNFFHEFRWTVAAGPVTAGIPVRLVGWGTNLPANTELYLEMVTPGSQGPVTSTTTVSSNNQWTTLSVTGNATTAGTVCVKIYLKKYVANATMYMDWPVGMDIKVLDWSDGRPNEYMVPAVPLAALTAESDMVSVPFSSPPYGYGQDKRSLRIDGPGVREFTIPVTTSLHVLRVQARYDQYHGTTNKPQAIIKAEPEIGLAQAQVDTMVVGADQWETLQFTFVPTASGVITLQLVSRSATPWGGAWFDNYSLE